MTVPLAQLDTTSSVRKRAQYEAFEFTIHERSVLVRNASYADPENHEYRVTISEGLPASCECPADAKYEGACKHRVAVAIRRPILDAVAHQQLVADGGPQTKPNATDDPETGQKPKEQDCNCADLGDGFPCWECYRNGRRELPND